MGMRKFTVTKEFTFDAAHRLVRGYPGKCAHIHGHTWKVRVSLGAESLDKFGFVRDYSDLKPIKQWLDENLDHATLVADEDLELRKFLAEHRQRHFIFSENPTSENMCVLVYKKARELGFNVTAVEVDETCTSCARLVIEGAEGVLC